MNILIIGSNGKVGRQLVKYLVEKKHDVRAMIRAQSQAEYLEKLGAQAFVADLEGDYSGAFEGMDAVIFTAGSGSSTGPEKTIDIDQNAAINSMKLALNFGIKRYVMVSALGANSPERPSPIQHYFKAKANADNHLVQSGLTYTIFRPGRLLDEPGNGLVTLQENLEYGGSISREDLANCIVESLGYKSTENKILDILDGDTSITEALNSF